MITGETYRRIRVGCLLNVQPFFFKNYHSSFTCEAREVEQQDISEERTLVTLRRLIKMGKYSNEIKKIFENMSDTLSVILEEEKAIIAGGIISRIFSGRSTKDSDVDVYFRSAESLARTLYAIGGTENIVTDWTDKSIMIKSGKNGCIVQFIIIDYFENAFQIFDKFDFTCVMGAYDLGIEDEVSSCFVFHEDFMMHNAQRKLVYNPKTEFPVISALRVHKYEKEG